MFRVPLIWAELLLWGQFFLCKFVFIADKDGKFVSITNRYHIQFVRVLLLPIIICTQCLAHYHNTIIIIIF